MRSGKELIEATRPFACEARARSWAYALSSVALAIPVVPATVATAAFEELHLTGPSTTSPLTEAVNCRLEFFNCLGLLGEMSSLPAAEQSKAGARIIPRRRLVVLTGISIGLPARFSIHPTALP